MRHAVPLLLLSAVVLGLAGCEPPVEGFETELRFVTPPNQDVFAELERLEVTFYYSGEEPIGFVIDEPFPGAQDLDDLPRAEPGEVRLEVLGWVEDGAAADGWRLAAQGEATDFALPAEDPITVFLALKGQLAELPGELIHPRSDGVAVPIDDHRAMIVGGLSEDGPVGPWSCSSGTPSGSTTGSRRRRTATCRGWATTRSWSPTAGRRSTGA